MVDNAIAVKVEAYYPEINANIRECAKSSGEALQHAMQAGALLIKLKDTLPHGHFQQAVEDRCDCSYDTARLYMKLAEKLPAVLKAKGKSLDKCELTIRGAVRLIPKAPPGIGKKTGAPVFSPTTGGTKTGSASRSAAPTTQAETPKSSLDAVVNASVSPPATGSAAVEGPCLKGGEHEFDDEGDCTKCGEPNYGKDQPGFDPAVIEAMPAKGIDIAALSEPYTRAVNDLNRIRRDMRKLADDESTGAYLVEKINRIEKAIDDAKTPIAQATPTEICQKCDGKKCVKCSNTGWWPKSVVEGLKK